MRGRVCGWGEMGVGLRLGLDLGTSLGLDLGAVHYTMLQAEDTWTPGHSPATGGGWGQHQH